MFKLQQVGIIKGDFLAYFAKTKFSGHFPAKWKGFLEKVLLYQHKCMHSWICECTWCKCNSEKLNTQDFQQGQLSLIQKVTRDLFFEWNIWLGQTTPSLIQKKSYRSFWLISCASTSIFRTRCLAISWVTTFWSPSLHQGLTIVLSSKHGDVLILFIEHSF